VLDLLGQFLCGKARGLNILSGRTVRRSLSSGVKKYFSSISSPGPIL
jgi:hypothetical protein